ncbi:glycosyltransferase [Ornithinimicrobium pekingense]|uniref:D-inositol 3-phosphate glycosyltransferase n=1 Tax=Ornithinimicrobium pekingense TaxID=384677 RepID=A0ABQ2F812_9MICO|nr:glycosyltransferase [Ornithinimicrobium pekingense]GGK71101.1 hypothetical protein GCM10011509_19410 [Ornithinimicrobium pekingense]
MTAPADGHPRVRVLHTCLEPATEGSACLAHSSAIAQGLRRRGLQVRTVWNTAGSSGKPVQWLRVWSGILRHLSGVDAVYCRWHAFDLPTCVLARLFRKRLVLEVNGGIGDIQIGHPRLRPVMPLLRLVTRVQLRLAHTVICVSPGLRDWARRLAPEGTEVTWAPNGTDPAIADLRRPASSPAHASYVGVLSSWQGIELLVAAATSPDWPDRLALDVVGDGPVADVVRDAAREHPHIRYHGRLPREQTLEVLATSSVSLCLPSSDLPRNQVNGTPFKLVETLMLGVPAVVSPLAHQIRAVRSVDGGRATAETPRDVARAVAAVVDEASEAARQALASRAARCFTWDGAVDVAARAVGARAVGAPAAGERMPP